MPVSNDVLVAAYFKQCGDNENTWKCVCGKTLTQKKGTGKSNLVSHIKSQHPDFEKKFAKSTVTNFYQSGASASRTATNIYGWMDLICMKLLPFSTVEDPITRKYTNLTPITRNTLLSYMELVTKEVENKVSGELPHRFALIIDSWSKGSNHFTAVFASYCVNKDEPQSALLSFSPLLTETSFTAKDYYDYIEFVLNTYNKNFENIVCITGDNAEVNRALADLCGVPLIGCASHKFNLAVKEFMERYSGALDKIHAVMTKLRTPKLGGELRAVTKLQPVMRNKTRWLLL